MLKKHIYTNDGEYIEGIIDPLTVDLCSASGCVLDNVKEALKRYDIKDDLKEKLVTYLKEFGAWDDLNVVSLDILKQRVFWIACCELREGEHFGITL